MAPYRKIGKRRFKLKTADIGLKEGVTKLPPFGLFPTLTNQFHATPSHEDEDEHDHDHEDEDSHNKLALMGVSSLGFNPGNRPRRIAP